MRDKDYQSNRNRYTKQSWPAVGERKEPCPEHWWDVKGRCVFCGEPKPLVTWAFRASGDGVVLLSSATDNGLWFESEESGRWWAAGMGIVLPPVETYPGVVPTLPPLKEGDCPNYREYGLVCNRGKDHDGNCGG